MKTEQELQIADMSRDSMNTGIKPMTDSELAAVCYEEIARGI